MFSTGEFSRIARVSKRLLQYYDEIGLLKPARIDSQSGYRYYSARQLPRLNQILALKELGLSLEQINQMLDDAVSDDEIFGMLLMQKAELEKRLQEDLQRFRRIEARLQRQRRGLSELPEVVVKAIPERRILTVSHLCINAEDGFRFISHLLQSLPGKVDQRGLGHVIALAQADEFVSENVDLEFGFFVEGQVPPTVTLADGLMLTTRTLPAVETMATTVHVGHIQTADATYGAIGEWIEVNGCRISGQQREIFIELPRPGHSEDIVLEIQFPVEKITPTHPLLSE
jgi:DNA-binding transcriptional MerR regulator